MKSILIAGGCGFLGTSLIARLLEGEDAPRIRVLDNRLGWRHEHSLHEGLIAAYRDIVRLAAERPWGRSLALAQASNTINVVIILLRCCNIKKYLEKRRLPTYASSRDERRHDAQFPAVPCCGEGR